MASTHLKQAAWRQSFVALESFRIHSASKGSQSETRLKRPRWLRKPVPDIATALSSGWFATAFNDDVRLYRLDDADLGREINKNENLIRCNPGWGKIRAIALSKDLLAIITYSHLVVFEHKVHVGVNHTPVDTRLINPSGTWTPHSVAIRQVEYAGPGVAPTAWIAVGGEGKHGVMVYKYTYNAGWDAQNDRITLSCLHNTSPIRHVGFSPDRPNSRDEVIVFGAAESNRIYCWGLGQGSTKWTPDPSWIFNCDVKMDGVPHQGELKAVRVFLSPAKKAYIFCAIDQHQGSQSLRSCIVPIGDTQRNDPAVLDTWQEFPENAMGRKVLCGTITPSGRFAIILEHGLMRLLTLQPASNGGLGCITSPEPLEWRSSLMPTSAEVSGISLSVRDEYGELEIIAADGRGTVEFRRVNIRDMSPPLDAQRDHFETLSSVGQTEVVYEAPEETRIVHEIPSPTTAKHGMPRKSPVRQRILSQISVRDRIKIPLKW